MNKKNEKSDKKNELKKVEEKKPLVVKKKKKIKKNITSGIAYVYSTFNNTIISIADENGNVVSWSSAGAKGLRFKEIDPMQLRLQPMMLEKKLTNKV